MAKTERMKITVAAAGFKGSLSAKEASRAICTGLKRASRIFLPVSLPMADGGAGTVDAILAAKGGRRVRTRVCDPLGRKITACYAILSDGRTAVVEMAAASGMALLKKREMNPMRTSTFGTGQLIISAIKKGARKIIVGLGDSATVDGGAGMAVALGARLLDSRGREIAPGGGGLEKLARIDVSGLEPRLKKTGIIVAADVANPLLGKNGAARIFAPQKGATPAQVERLERGLANFARVVGRDIGVRLRGVKYAGAAGGLAAGLLAFLGASLRSGGETVAGIIGLKKSVRASHLVITGEGRVDAQTAQGKAPAQVAATAKAAGRPVFVFCGTLGEGWEKLGRIGVDAVFPLAEKKRATPPKKEAYRQLRETAERVGRLLIECAR